MSDAPDYGRSYWEIVVRAFRKNRNARGALWLATTMIAIAILTPLLANDRPYAFKGTLPDAFRKSYLALRGPAILQLVNSPRAMSAEIARFQSGEASQLEFMNRATEPEAAVFFPIRERLRKLAEGQPEIRARWISMDITLKEMAAEMTPAERAGFDPIPGRIIGRLPGIHRKELQPKIDAIRLKLREVRAQVNDALREKAREYERRLDDLVKGDLMAELDNRRDAFLKLASEIRETFDPEKVALESRWRWPLFDSLSALDVFFITALFLGLVAFGPLTWLKLGKIHPIERRWGVTWSIALAPALLLAAAWFLFHTPTFDTVRYQDRAAEGAERQVVMESAVWPPIPHRYDEQPEDPNERLKSPSWAHVMGTDYLGRDLLARMMWGSRVSLSIGFVSAGIAAMIGIALGATAGYFRGWVDMGLSRLIEIMLCFPIFFLILAVVAFLPPSLYYVMLVLGIFGWMGIARLQRGEFLRLLGMDYVQAARALGASDARIMFRHLLPNALGPVLVAASFGVATAMLTESALSFLGLGVTEPETSWGQILNVGQKQLANGTDQWWTFMFPGAAIFVAVTCYNLVGDGIRDAVDPRLKG